MTVLVAASFGSVATAEDDPASDEPSPRFVTSDDGRRLLQVASDGSTSEAWSLDAWHAWAAPRWDRLFVEAPSLAWRTMTPDDASWIGPAVLAPDGRTLAFVVSAYAAASTTSLVGTVDLIDGTVRTVADPKRGTVEDPVWSSDGRFLAYGLGTARSGGEALVVDDVRIGRERLRIEGAALMEALRSPGADVAADGAEDGAADGAEAFLPQIRDVRFLGDARLRFRSDDPAALSRDVDGPTGPGQAWELDLDALRDAAWDRVGGARVDLAPARAPERKEGEETGSDGSHTH
ncbi:MAG: hypothetical protein WD336_09660 [Trueperaceae bacterium]